MNTLTRRATNKLLELIEDGLLDRDTVINACLNYMSEADVADMCHCEGLFEGLEDDEETEE